MELTAFVDSISEEKLRIMVQNVIRKKQNPESKSSGKTGREFGRESIGSIAPGIGLAIAASTKNPFSRMLKKSVFSGSSGTLMSLPTVASSSREKLDSETIFGSTIKVLDCEAAEV